MKLKQIKISFKFHLRKRSTFNSISKKLRRLMSLNLREEMLSLEANQGLVAKVALIPQLQTKLIKEVASVKLKRSFQIGE